LTIDYKPNQQTPYRLPTTRWMASSTSPQGVKWILVGLCQLLTRWQHRRVAAKAMMLLALLACLLRCFKTGALLFFFLLFS
jgi:hypothetical protein